MRAGRFGWLTAGVCLAMLWPMLRVEPARAYERPWLGTYVGDAAAPRIGGDSSRWHGAARVVRVEGPAASAGLEILDEIVEVDGEPIAGSKDLTCRIAARTPGADVRLTIVRERRQLQLTATLGHWPEPGEADHPPSGCIGDLLSGGWAARPA